MFLVYLGVIVGHVVSKARKLPNLLQPEPWAHDQGKGGCKVASQEGDPEVTPHAPENAKSVRE